MVILAVTKGGCQHTSRLIKRAYIESWSVEISVWRKFGRKLSTVLNLKERCRLASERSSSTKNRLFRHGNGSTHG
jgi:hypothetical protein